MNCWKAHIITFFLLLAVDSHAQLPVELSTSKNVFSLFEGAYSKGDLQEAYDILIQMSIDPEDEKSLCVYHFYSGIIAEHVSPSQAKSNYQVAAAKLSSITDSKDRGGIAQYIANWSISQQEMELAESMTLIELDIKAYPDSLRAESLERMAIIMIGRQESGAISLLRKALDLRDNTKNLPEVLRLLNEISTLYHQSGNLDSAEFFFEKSIELKRVTKDTLGLMSDLTSIGKLNKERGDFTSAQNILIQAYALSESVKDTFSMISLLGDLGDILKEQHLVDQAKDYYLKALDLLNITDRKFLRAELLINLSEIESNSPEKAATYLEEALSIYEELNNKRGEAKTLILLSNIYQSSFNTAKAKVLLEQALKDRIKDDDVPGTLDIILALSGVHLTLGNLANAEAHAYRALEGFKANDDLNGKRNAYRLLSQIFEDKGAFNKALSYYKKERSLSDSLLSVEKSEVINRLTLQYETQKKDKELAQQKAEIQSQQSEIESRKSQSLILLIGIVLIIGFAGFLIFRNRKNQQLSKEKIKRLQSEKEAASLKSMIAGEEQERQRLSQELHDGLGAVLSTVKMEISGLTYESPQIENNSNYIKAKDLIDNACRTVREISHDLMPFELEHQGIELAIRELCHNISRHNDLSIEFLFYGDANRLNDVKTTSLYRITQELLKNILKHSKASECLVQLTIDDEAILVVEDNGIGFNPNDNTGGIGLRNINNRVDFIGGKLEVSSKTNEGTTVTVITKPDK